MQNLKIVPFVVAADVVRFAAAALMENEVYGLAVVEHIEPVAYVGAVAVHGNGLFCKASAYDDGNELFLMLLGTVVVRAVGGCHVHAVGVMVGSDDEVRSCLAGGIGAVGGIGRVFGKVAGSPERSVHFIGGNVVEAGVFIAGLYLARRVHPVSACRFHEREGSHVVGFHEGARTFYGIVHVAFRRKMDNAANVVLREQLFQKSLVAYVAMHERVVGHGLAFPQEISRIGELVEIDDLIFRILRAEVRNKVGTDEAGSAGDEYGFHGTVP